jgi:hypothetical protein
MEKFDHIIQYTYINGWVYRCEQVIEIITTITDFLAVISIIFDAMTGIFTYVVLVNFHCLFISTCIFKIVF